jgi:protein-L-isoaspartate(D-aspartate) O-methyltransferase
VYGDDPRESLRDALRGRCRDPRVVEAILATPRDHYVPEALRAYAWDDRALPIDAGQTISQPTMVAIMTDALQPAEGDVVLDVGTGSGYQAAILARLVARVYGIERVVALARAAKRRLDADPGIARAVHVVAADAWLGFPGALRFDGIVIAAQAPEVPARLLDQLAPGGRLLVPLGPRGAVQELARVRRRADGSFAPAEWLGACAFVPLVRAG